MLNENQIFWINLEKVKIALLQNDREFAQFLGMNFTAYLKSKMTQSFLPLDCIFMCAEKLNFHFEDLLKADFKISYTPQGHEAAIAERYSYATYSGTRPIINIVDFLEQHRGTRAKVNLMRKFQLSENFLSDSTQKTNIFLITDIVDYLDKTYNFSNSEFLAMGQRTPIVSRSLFMNDEFLSKRTIQETLQHFIEECGPFFDKNNKYRILEMFGDYAIVEALPNKHVLEELEIRPHQFGSEKHCLTRTGVFSSITWHKYHTYAKVKKIASLYEGASSNKYLFDMTPFRKTNTPSFELLKSSNLLQ